MTTFLRAFLLTVIFWSIVFAVVGVYVTVPAWLQFSWGVGVGVTFSAAWRRQKPVTAP